MSLSGVLYVAKVFRSAALNNINVVCKTTWRGGVLVDTCFFLQTLFLKNGDTYVDTLQKSRHSV